MQAGLYITPARDHAKLPQSGQKLMSADMADTGEHVGSTAGEDLGCLP